MSEFGDRFTAAGITKLLGHLGDSVTYTPVSTGVGVSRTAIFNEMVGVAGDKEANAIFTMSSNASTGVASPARGDRITTSDNRVWSIIDIRSDAAGTHELRATTPELIA
ncbi:MAG TPA: hypothetical protein VEA38_12120 [Terriglobales bacterium]|nr:hypothetical protein [Terriglobales bacterium]